MSSSPHSSCHFHRTQACYHNQIPFCFMQVLRSWSRAPTRASRLTKNGERKVFKEGILSRCCVQSDVSVIQALIVYGADVNSENDKGETPRHLASVSKVSKKDQVLYTLHAVGARRCPRDHGCADGCSANGSFDGAAPDKPNFFKASRRERLCFNSLAS